MALGRPPVYPWNDWFATLEAREPLHLYAGVDYAVPLDSFQRMVAAEARRRGVKIRTRRQQGGTKLRVDRVSNTRHPWARWLDGQPHPLRPGTDFFVDVEVFRQQAKRAARVRGVRLRSAKRDGLLWIQALPPDSNALESSQT